MFLKKLILSLILLVMGLNAQSNDKINLYLDWLHQFQFAGYYVAKEKGYYNTVGLDVEIKEFNSNSNILKNVIENDASYGIGKSSLIIDKFNKNDLVFLSSIYQNSPLVLISLKESNINSPKDLANKKVMITNDAISSATINSMIISQGVKLDDIILKKHTFDINDLINKKVDAMACFLSNEPYLLDKKKIQYNILNPHNYNYNFDFYDGILYTSQNELSNNPSRVQNFNEASLKGWKYAFNNIEETAKLIYEKYNTQNKSLDALIYEGNILKKLSKIDHGLLGNINPKTIDELKRFYSYLGLNTQNETFDTNSIILERKSVLLDEAETKYLENNNFALLVEDNNVPFSFKLNNEFKGIEIDFWNLFSNKLSKPLNIEETIANKIFNIFSNTIKVQFVYSFEKKSTSEYLLSDSVAEIPIALVTKNDKNFISDLSTLKNAQIAVNNNLGIIKTLQKKYPGINFISIESIDNALTKLERNELFAIIDNMYSISHRINKNNLNNIKINTLLEQELNIYLQVEEKDKALINILNSAINRFTKEDKNNILNNYQFIFYPKNIDLYFIAKIIVPLILLLIIFIYFNFKLKKEIGKRKEIEKQLSELANKDGLTNIYNRRKIEELCELEIIRSKRYKNNLSIIFFDINDFKYVNDNLGHHLGDEVLVKITDIIEKNIRTSDFIGRWGGDEFLIILPQTNIMQCEGIVFNLKNLLTQINFSESINITCSFGIAAHKENDTLDSLLKKADESMYTQKANHKKIKN